METELQKRIAELKALKETALAARQDVELAESQLRELGFLKAKDTGELTVWRKVTEEIALIK